LQNGDQPFALAVVSSLTPKATPPPDCPVVCTDDKQEMLGQCHRRRLEAIQERKNHQAWPTPVVSREESFLHQA